MSSNSSSSFPCHDDRRKTCGSSVAVIIGFVLLGFILGSSFFPNKILLSSNNTTMISTTTTTTTTTTTRRKKKNNNKNNNPKDILERLQTQLETCAARLDQAMITEFQKNDEQASASPSTGLQSSNDNNNNNSNNNSTTTASATPTTTTTTSAAICAIQKGELYSLDEWVDYHLALGFDTIYIYDNLDDPLELRQWNQKNSRDPHRVVVRHFPGQVQQLKAYQDCHSKQRRSDEISIRFGVSKYRHDWLAFLDIDEFIVLKQHDTIQDLLQDVVPHDKAGLSLHRLTYYFDVESQLDYEPIPVTKRFQHRLVDVDINVKTISRTNMIARPIVHHVDYVGRKQLAIDTAGHKVLNGYSPKKPTDVAVIHHYATKSLSEFESKCQRGDAFYGNYHINNNNEDGKAKTKNSSSNNNNNNTIGEVSNSTALTNTTTTNTTNTTNTNNTKRAWRGNQRACMPRDWIIETIRNSTVNGGGVVFDDAAWQFLVQSVPQYAKYNGILQ